MGLLAGPAARTDVPLVALVLASDAKSSTIPSMMPIILSVFVFSLLLERLFKFYGSESPIALAATSFAILGMSVYIIAADYSPHDKNWAYVSVGIVVGLWLKNSRPGVPRLTTQSNDI
jgi:hypothetical protein